MSMTRDIMTRLKEDTRSLHDAAEQQEYMHALMAGTLSRERYFASIQQMYLLQSGLASRLEALKARSDLATKVLKDYHFQHAEAARADLDHFGLSVEGVEPNAGVEEFLARFDHWMEKDPDAAMGMVYVLEGSLNGAKIIKKKLQELFHIEGEAGLRHQDPYGDQMRPRWMEFVMTVNSHPLSDESQDSMVEAAGDAFRAMGRFYAAVCEEVA